MPGVTPMSRISVLKEKAGHLLGSNRLPEAKDLYDEICRMDDRDAEAWFMLGGIHGRLGSHEQAVNCCQRAIAIEPQNAAAYCNMGNALQALGRLNEALGCYQQALRLQPGFADAHYNMGNLMRDQGHFDPAEQCYRQAVQHDPGMAVAHYYLGNMLRIQSRVEEAVASYESALRINPDFPEAYWNKLRILPVVYDSQDQVDYYRRKYADGLRELGEKISLDTPQARTSALRGAAANTNFYLQYQGQDDLELQKQYGALAHRIMAASFSQWARELDMPPMSANGKIRVGYASAFLRSHNGAVWLLGWLRHRNGEGFEVYCYHTGTKVDEKTEEFKRHCDYFRHIPGDLAKACEQIRADKLHILVYPELGMDAPSMLMAGLRLAPVQCVGWGHPITSGLPTMDYWLSSDLMEPPNGQDHYSEKLVRLANMGHCYSKEQHDRLQSTPPPKSRSDFKLRDDAVLYLCSQSLFKYLPQHDFIFPEIARRVPNAQFVFLAISSVHVVKRFMERIDRAFTQAGLSAKNYCMMLNRLTPQDYLALNRVVDVFLDNPSWSGNNTTLAAIDCHLPVVTFPTEFMRGRHSYAILKMLGVTETIAQDPQGYIDIAARLGTGPEWRRSIVQQIVDRHELVYEDKSCVQTLEFFYKEAVESRS